MSRASEEDARTISAVPRLCLGRWPTPVTRADRLGRALGLDPLWIKRDDLSADPIGGTKVRKLEFLLASRPERVLTCGGTGSHHVLATAWFNRRLGGRTAAILARQPATQHGERMERLIRSCCDRVIPVFSWPALGARAIFERLADPGALYVPVGGSSPRGVLGCVAAGLELASQVAAGELPAPATLVVATGSGGTAAGLLLGLELAGMRTRVLAVRVSTRLTGNASAIRRLAHRTALSHGLAGLSGAASVEVIHTHLGRGYGHPTAAGEHASRLAIDEEGIELEPVYTGKALAALAEAARTLAGPVLFWDTYGPPRLDEPCGIA